VKGFSPLRNVKESWWLSNVRHQLFTSQRWWYYLIRPPRVLSLLNWSTTSSILPRPTTW